MAASDPGPPGGRLGSGPVPGAPDPDRDSEDRDDEMLVLKEICDQSSFFYFDPPRDKDVGGADWDLEWNRILTGLIQLLFRKVDSPFSDGQSRSGLPDMVDLYRDCGWFLRIERQSCAKAGRLLLTPRMDCSPLKVVSNDCKTGLCDVRHLPPVCLDFMLPKTYPSASVPRFRLFCPWLTPKQVDRVADRLHEVAVEQRDLGNVVLFLWVTFLQEELLTFLGIRSELNISRNSSKRASNTSSQAASTSGSTSSAVNWKRSPDGHSAEEVEKRYFGVVKKWLEHKRFGFILIMGDSADRNSRRREAPKEAFLVPKNLPEGMEGLEKGTLVSFGLEESRLQLRRDSRRFPSHCFPNPPQRLPMAVAVRVELDLESRPKPDKASEAPSPATKLPDDDVSSVSTLIRWYDAEMEDFEFRRSVFTCHICFSEKSGSKSLRFQGCHHVFCNDCMVRYFETQIKQGMMNNLTCPHDGCRRQALPTQVKQLVSKELYDTYESQLLSTALETMSDVARCPRTECQCPTLVERETRMGRCPQCYFSFCILCQAAYHGLAPCSIRSRERKDLIIRYINAGGEEKSALEKRYGRRQLSVMADSYLSEQYLVENTKKCPKCQAPIQKTEGCNKMTCNKCDTCFCYLCGAKLSKQDPYAHFREMGSQCYNLLFHGVEEPVDPFFEDDNRADDYYLDHIWEYVLDGDGQYLEEGDDEFVIFAQQ